MLLLTIIVGLAALGSFLIDLIVNWERLRIWLQTHIPAIHLPKHFFLVLGFLLAFIALYLGIFHPEIGWWQSKSKVNTTSSNKLTKAEQPSPQPINSLQPTSDEVKQRIVMWLLTTDATIRPISDKDSYFRLEINHDNGLVYVVYPLHNKNLTENVANINVANDAKQILDQMTLKERELFVRELQLEMLKFQDVFYTGLEYPFAGIMIYNSVPLDVTRVAFLEKLNAVFRARQLLFQSISTKIVEIQTRNTPLPQ